MAAVDAPADGRLAMSQPSGSKDPRLISYQNLRQAIGWIGVALPIVVAAGKAVTQGPGIQESISAYYYTDMRNYFVGSLCAIGIFLMTYRGYDWRDLAAGRMACVFAIGVAFFPTTPSPTATHFQKIIGGMHLTFAALLFLTLSYFSWFLFTQTDPNGTPTPRKRQRNRVYRVCAVVMVACIVLIPFVRPGGWFPLSWWPHAVFCLESLTIIAFGVSWLTKGEGILAD
jgi:hypothetical protein